MGELAWADRVPWGVPVAAVAVALVGLSAIERGDELVGATGTAGRQAVWVGLGLVAMAVAAAMPYRALLPLAGPAFGLTLVVLVGVLFTPARNGASRWVPLGPLFLQPSELAKLTFVVALAANLRRGERHRSLAGLVPPLLIAFAPMGLVLVEPDLGTALVFLPVLFAMLFAAGARPRHLAAAAVAGALALPVLWTQMSAEQRSRVTAVFTQADAGEAPRGDGYHLHQSKRMLALGGRWGSELSGMTEADPLAYHLPAGRTDFVFCLVGERWGVAGCGVTLLLYGALVVRGFAVATRTREPFGRLLATGVVALLATQVAINTLMTVGLAPITGLTLPLMSYGGSSVLATFASLGLVIGVAVRPGHDVAPAAFRFERRAA